jgi:DNA-binding XRE family transcriptional regulator
MKHPLYQAYESCIMAYEQSRVMRSLGRKTFAAQLRETRKKLKMTVRELGDKIGVTGSLVNQIEVNSKSILKKQQVEKVIALCTSSSSSTMADTTLESVLTPQETQVQCTNEVPLSQEV